MITARKARNMIKKKFPDVEIIKARTVSFIDLARDRAVVVEVRLPDPKYYNDVKKFAYKNGFQVDFV